MQGVETSGARVGTADERVRRTHAHGRARRHSAKVRALRRVIPFGSAAAVLALGAATLLNPFAAGMPEVTLGPVGVSGTKVTMENPRLSGFRKGDQGYEVTAAAALQDVRRPSLVELRAMRGHLDTGDGGRAHLEAASGVFDSSREALALDQDIRLWTDKGEEVRLRSASVDFKAGSVRSTEPVAVAIPAGSITADALDVAEGGKVISFVGRVRAVLHGTAADAAPGKRDGAAPGTSRILTSSAEAEARP